MEFTLAYPIRRREPPSGAAIQCLSEPLDLPVPGMKAKVKYHIPLRGTKAREEYYGFVATAPRKDGLGKGLYEIKAAHGQNNL